MEKNVILIYKWVARVCYTIVRIFSFASIPIFPLTPLPLFAGGLTCVKSLLTWPWDQCCIAGDSLLCEGLVTECCPRLIELFVVELGYVPFTHGDFFIKTAFLDLDDEFVRIHQRILQTLGHALWELFYRA